MAPYAQRGWQIDLEFTRAPGHGIQLAREATASGVDTVIACGGDGTLNEVINGLAGSETRLALLRAGTGNVFAKEVGVPRDLEEALSVLVDGEERRFDLGLAGGRYFLLMCGIGIDAEIVRRVPSSPKRLLGTAIYGLWGMVVLPIFRPRRVSLKVDGEEDAHDVDLSWLLLGNTRSYGGVIDITSHAVADDGLLDAYIFAGNSYHWAASTVMRVALKRQKHAPGIYTRRLREIEILTPGLPVQADGEYIGRTPIKVSVVPRALSILLPSGRRQQLLSLAGPTKLSV